MEWGTNDNDWGEDWGETKQKSSRDYNNWDLNKLDTKALVEEKKKMDI